MPILLHLEKCISRQNLPTFTPVRNMALDIDWNKSTNFSPVLVTFKNIKLIHFLGLCEQMNDHRRLYSQLKQSRKESLKKFRLERDSRALHRYHRGHGFESRSNFFFRLSLLRWTFTYSFFLPQFKCMDFHNYYIHFHLRTVLATPHLSRHCSVLVYNYDCDSFFCLPKAKWRQTVTQYWIVTSYSVFIVYGRTAHNGYSSNNRHAAPNGHATHGAHTSPNGNATLGINDRGWNRFNDGLPRIN